MPRIADFSTLANMGVVMLTCTTRTARILDSGRELRTIEIHPEAQVAFCLRSDSPGCIIVTTVLPDTDQLFTFPRQHIHAACARTGSYPERTLHSSTQLLTEFGLSFKLRRGRIGPGFVADEILANHNPKMGRHGDG